MHLTVLIPTSQLATTCTATTLNIRFYTDSTACASANYGQCTATDNGCCSSPASAPGTWKSTGFSAILAGTRITARGYRATGCANSGYISAMTTGQTEICFPVADLGSANFRTVAAGARHGVERDERGVGDVECAKLDIIVVDGVEYNMAGLDEGQYDAMVSVNYVLVHILRIPGRAA